MTLFPLFISTTERRGGAAIAAHRLYKGLHKIDVPARMLVYFRQSQDPDVIRAQDIVSRWQRQRLKWSVDLDKRPLKLLYPQRDTRQYWSLNWLPGVIHEAINNLSPDVVHLHWIGDGFLPLPSFSHIQVPIVWTLHDYWAFTGGCHYPDGCERYQQDCGHCPQLGSGRENDLSRWIVNQKRRNWQQPLTVVAPSHDLADKARRSALFAQMRVLVIPHGIDTDLYQQHDVAAARHAFDLPTDKKLILFGATGGTRDPRKGFAYLRDALAQLAQSGQSDRYELVVFGQDKPSTASDLPLPTHYLGAIHDEAHLALAYSAADVFVGPSLDEIFGNTVQEALACGTPAVGFRVGGLKDMIRHQENGYLAQPFDPADLARGITWVLEDQERHQRLSAAARQTVLDQFRLEDIARRYLDLYTELRQLEP